MEVQRLGDLAFAEFKEKLYRQEIPWEEIVSSTHEKVNVIDDVVVLSLEPVGTRKFKRTATVHSIGKKGKQGEEWRLATFRVEFKPAESRLFRGKNKNKDRTFIYQVLLEKKPNLPPASLQENLPKAIETG